MAIIIPQTKSEIVADVQATSAGSITRDVIIENDAISFVVMLENVPSNVNISVHELKNNKVIAPAAIVTDVTGTGLSKRYAKVVDNKLRFIITYDGPANFSIIAKAVSSSAIPIVDGLTSGALSGPGIEGTKLVSTTPVEICVGDEALEGRALIIAYNASSHTMYWGRTPAVSATTGIPLFKDQVASWAFTDTAKVYIMCPANGGGILRITESKLYV